MDHTQRSDGTEYVGEVAETALGPVEYAVVGHGTPVLVLHGSPGGIDAAALMARILPRDGVAAILLSRPGYLGTPSMGAAPSTSRPTCSARCSTTCTSTAPASTRGPAADRPATGSRSAIPSG